MFKYLRSYSGSAEERRRGTLSAVSTACRCMRKGAVRAALSGRV